MTPVLLLFFGVAPVTAIATDLWFAAITKVVAAHIHHNSGQVDWMIVKRLWSGSLPVALLVVLAIGLGVKIEEVAWLTQAIGILVITIAIGLMHLDFKFNKLACFLHIFQNNCIIHNSGINGLRQSTQSTRDALTEFNGTSFHKNPRNNTHAN